jgi:hypothetical protein
MSRRRSPGSRPNCGTASPAGEGPRRSPRVNSDPGPRCRCGAATTERRVVVRCPRPGARFCVVRQRPVRQSRSWGGGSGCRSVNTERRFRARLALAVAALDMTAAVHSASSTGRTGSSCQRVVARMPARQGTRARTARPGRPDVVVGELVARPDQLRVVVRHVLHDRADETDPGDPVRQQLDEAEGDDRLAARRAHRPRLDGSRHRRT